MRLFILVVTLAVTLTFVNVLKFPPTSFAFGAERSEGMLTECRESYKEYQCFVLFKFGVYPPEPFIDMRGSAFAEVLPKMAEPIAENKPPSPRRRPQAEAAAGDTKRD